MEAKDVKSLPWKKVTDWSDLCTSEEDFWGGSQFVGSTDVNAFVENVFRDCSRKLNIPYEELKPILVAENEAFYILKKAMFDRHSGYGLKNSKLIALENTLRVPDIKEDKVTCCLKIFEELSDIEKMVFLQKIGNINVTVERAEETS